MLNLPTDLSHRYAMQKHCRETTACLRECVIKKHPSDIRMDLLPIMMEDVAVNHAVQNSKGRHVRRVEVGSKGKLTVEQGKLVTLIGPRGGGKSTLLRILGGAVLPGKDNIKGFFIPSHLRVLNVESTAAFISGTLMDNLIFGVAKGDPDGSLQRVKTICTMLDMPEEILAMIDSEDELNWHEVVSQSQAQLLSLARALIANPDVLILHRPMFLFDEHTADIVVGLLKDFVRQRGVVQEAETFYRRRPRTCIMTSSMLQGLQAYDQVFCVTGGGIRELTKEEAMNPRSICFKSAPVFL